MKLAPILRNRARHFQKLAEWEAAEGQKVETKDEGFL